MAWNKAGLTVLVVVAAGLIILMGPDLAFRGAEQPLREMSSRSSGLSPYTFLAIVELLVFCRFIWTSPSNFRAAKEGVVVLALFQIYLVFNADVSASHILNASWPGHAKFHDAWLVSLIIITQLMAIYYIISLREPNDVWYERMKFACVLGFSTPFSVVFPSVLMPLYHGSYNVAGFGNDPTTLGIDIVLLLFIILVLIWLVLLAAVRARYRTAIQQKKENLCH